MRMKITIALFSLLVSLKASAQETNLLTNEELENEFVFESMEDAMADPLKVVKLDLSKQKLLNVEYDFQKMKNIQWLDLSKNDLSSFPTVITELPNLQYLDLSRNDIDAIPDEIGKLQHLKKLAMSKNKVYVISPDMGKLKQLEEIDLWDNPIKSFPEEIRGMSSLKKFDLRVTVINESEKRKLMKLFPDTDIKFSKTCNCN